MTPTRQWTLLGVAIACAAGLYGFQRAERQRDVHELERKQELEALRQELDELRTDRAAHARIAARLAGNAAGTWRQEMAAPADAEVDQAGDAASPAESAAEPVAPEMSDEEMKAVVLASVHSVFDAEVRDAAWSTQADRQLLQVVKAQLPKGSRLEKAECRTSLCKVETRHTSLAEFQAFVNDALMDRKQQPWNGGIYAAVIEQSDEGVVAVSYLAKEGQSVPLPEI